MNDEQYNDNDVNDFTDQWRMPRAADDAVDTDLSIGETDDLDEDEISDEEARLVAEALDLPIEEEAPVRPARSRTTALFTAPLFQAPAPVKPARAVEDDEPSRGRGEPDDFDEDDIADEDSNDTDAAADDDDDAPRRRRRRGGRGRRKTVDRDGEDSEESDAELAEAPQESAEEAPAEDSEDSEATGTRRRRRRRRGSAEDAPTSDDPPQTVVKVREPRARKTRTAEEKEGDDARDDVRSIRGSTRLEAKKQRRREGREQGRRRVPVITEAEFLARREAVERVMAVRQIEDRTQIAVLEDGVLVEHYVNRASATSYVGNVYLGKVQNVLPSMEAAFVDIGKSRNAVLYAGEVNWDAANLDGQPRRIESALKSGDSVLVQVTKDPIGHKGSRLTSQVSLPGRFLVYVPDGQMTGISRKLPDTERSRLKAILRAVLPEGAGVIVRTAAEGASEEELSRDVARLQGQWEAISEKAASAAAPALLHSEPDLTTRVIRDIFNEDFGRLLVSGDDAWEAVAPYVEAVAPDLVERMERWDESRDLFAEYRVDEQLAKALDRKVFLPSGGSLVIDRTEAMVVVDVNTGKFTGKGGNLEETVTKNNLEAAEEIVRQLRLRDLGGIIVIDFIDMVLESNRELVLRRLLECLGRDRTKHQVAEVTSLGLVQMTRKRVGQGLIEAFSEQCETCAGRGVIVSYDAAGRPLHQADRHEPTTASNSGGGNNGGSKKAAVSGLSPDVLARMPTPRTASADPAPAKRSRRGATSAPVAEVIDESAPETPTDSAPVEEEKPTRGRRARVRGGARRSAGAPEPVAEESTPAEQHSSVDIIRAEDPAEAPAAHREPHREPVMPASPEAAAPETVTPAESSVPVAGTTTTATRQRRPRRATRPAGSATAPTHPED